MTLAQERAATRAGITAARTSTLRRDLNSLETQRRQIRELVTLERRGLRPATKGRGTWDPNKPTIGGGGGGIASPLTETVYAARTFWPEAILQSTDGLLSFKVKPIKEITQTDDNDLEVKQVFANPAVAP
ncbi:hypothetical protein M2318_002721 [Metapseudomonas resinovorans]|uniref:hypothetical protein n=1 Tax=Metapseudomonas resinovorans TaxID=53412 RepID=UPI003D20E389